MTLGVDLENRTECTTPNVALIFACHAIAKPLHFFRFAVEILSKKMKLN